MEKLKGSFYLMGGFALAGTSVIAARFVSQNLGTFTITAVSLFFTLLCLLPFCARRLGQAFAQMTLRDWLALAFQATCGVFLFRMFLIQGLMRTSAGEAGILTGVTPAATAALAVFLLKERFNTKRFLGIASTVAGVAALQGLFAPGNGLSLQHSLGNLLVICAAICEALFEVFSRSNNLRSGPGVAQRLDPDVQTWLVALIAFLLCLVPAAFERPVEALELLPWSGWLALLWYGMFVTALSFILFYAGIKRCSASTAAVFSGMMPFTALVLSVLVLGEAAGLQEWLGGATIVVGMVLVGD